jgi:hypothetical protein
MKNPNNAVELLIFFLVIGAVTFGISLPSRDQRFIKAVAVNNTNEVVKMLKWGADVNYRTKNDHKTALMIAAGNGDAALIELLIKSGGDMSLIDRFGMTAFDYGNGCGLTNWNEITNRGRINDSTR